MNTPTIYTRKCPYCDWERAHMLRDTLDRMVAAHIQKTHPDKDPQ